MYLTKQEKGGPQTVAEDDPALKKKEKELPYHSVTNPSRVTPDQSRYITLQPSSLQR